uniref:Zn(2)-C6 fungal-type domain-containing protein n=1 Tax=Moniliophthora roreri TaxID=221103 RepID=A0A0W0EVD3_MONRR
MASEIPSEVPSSSSPSTIPKSTEADRPPVRTKRRYGASCELCRRRKRKCPGRDSTGKTLCTHCSEVGVKCVFPPNGKNSRVPKPNPSTSEPPNSEVNSLQRYIHQLALAEPQHRDRMLNQWTRDGRIDFTPPNAGDDITATSDDEGFDSPSARMDEMNNRKRPSKKLRTQAQDRERSPSAEETDDQDDDTQWRPESALRLSLKPATPTDSDNSSHTEEVERTRPAPPNQQVSSWVDYYISSSIPAEYEADGISQEHSNLLLANFFCWQGPRNSIVDKAVLEAAMRENDPKYYSKFLLYAIYTHTMRYVPQLAERSHEYTAKTHLLLAAAMSRPSSIPTAQGMLLLASNHAARGMYAQAWYLTASAVGMIIDLECHSEKSLDENVGEKYSERVYMHKQMRLRIFWAAYNWDRHVYRLLSLCLNRTPLLNPEDRHPPLPDPKDSDNLWTPCLAANSPQILFTYKAQPCHEAKCFHEYTRACQFLDEIHRNLYRRKLRPQHAHQFASNMRDRLLDWQAAAIKDVVIQDFDKFTTAPPPHILQLNLLVQLVWILLYRPFYYVSSKDSNKAVPHAVSTCECAAVKITDILALYDSHYSLARASYVVIFAAFLAATVDLALADRQRSVSEAIFGRLTLCNRVLSGGSHNIPGMQSSVQSLERHLQEILCRYNNGMHSGLHLTSPDVGSPSAFSSMSSPASVPTPVQNDSPRPPSGHATGSSSASVPADVQFVPASHQQPPAVTRMSSYSESPPHIHSVEVANPNVYPLVQMDPGQASYHRHAHPGQQTQVHHGYQTHPPPPQETPNGSSIMTPFMPYSASRTLQQPTAADYTSSTSQERYVHTNRRQSIMSPEATQQYSPVSPQRPNEEQYVEYSVGAYEEQQQQQQHFSAFFYPQDHYGYQQWSSTPV